jgi:hypothetical protein
VHKERWRKMENTEHTEHVMKAEKNKQKTISRREDNITISRKSSILLKMTFS